MKNQAKRGSLELGNYHFGYLKAKITLKIKIRTGKLTLKKNKRRKKEHFNKEWKTFYNQPAAEAQTILVHICVKTHEVKVNIFLCIFMLLVSYSQWFFIFNITLLDTFYCVTINKSCYELYENKPKIFRFNLPFYLIQHTSMLIWPHSVKIKLSILLSITITFSFSKQYSKHGGSSINFNTFITLSNPHLTMRWFKI